MRRLAALVVLFLAAWVLAVPGARGTAGDEECFIASINSARAAAGVRAIPVDANMTAIAESHSAAMAAAGDIFHTGGSVSTPEPGPAAFRAALPLPYSAARGVGENVGMGPTCAAVIGAFLASAPHYANMVHPSWTAFGVGVAWGYNGNELFVTEFFVQMPSAPAPLPPPPPRVPTSPPVPRPPPPSPRRPPSPKPVTVASPAVLPPPPPSPSPAPSPSPTPVTPTVVLPSPIERAPVDQRRHRGPGAWLVLGALLVAIGVGGWTWSRRHTH